MTTLTADDVVSLNAGFEDAQPQEIVRWALEDADLGRIAIASAFQAEGTCVMHMATRIRPDVPILFLETGYQFAETLEFRDRMVRELGLRVTNLHGRYTPAQQAEALGPRLFEREPERCCELNKVEPMLEALRGLDAWMTALRRDSAPTRADSPIVDRYELQPGHWIVKVNPVANWTRPDVWRYLKAHDLPHHPLYDLGYSSIGCAPCTRVRLPGEPERAGRWAGTPRWECGIHQVPDAAGTPRGGGRASAADDGSATDR